MDRTTPSPKRSTSRRVGKALRDDQVDAACRQPARLGHRRRARQDQRPPRAQPREQGLVGQAEVETQDRRAEFQKDVDGGIVDRSSSLHGSGLLRVESEFAVIRRQGCAPRPFTFRIRHWHPMTEEVEVDRARRRCGQAHELGKQRVLTEHRAGQGAETAGVGDRDRQGGVLHTGHRRLEDRQLDAQALGQRIHDGRAASGSESSIASSPSSSRDAASTADNASRTTGA